MKTFISSDFHGKNPAELVKSLLRNGEINRAVFLGDYDDPKILEKILELDIDKIVLIGNHEYNFAHKLPLYSSNLSRPLKEYWDIWGETLAGRFARECPEQIIEDKKIYLHGSLVDSWADGPERLWGRILHDEIGFEPERRIICNFREMKKENYGIMFRGHDHFPIIFSTNREEYEENINQIRSSIDSTILNEEDMHIVNLGAFVEGEYAIFDDESRFFEFRNSKDLLVT